MLRVINSLINLREIKNVFKNLSEKAFEYPQYPQMELLVSERNLGLRQ